MKIEMQVAAKVAMAHWAMLSDRASINKNKKFWYLSTTLKLAEQKVLTY